MMNRSGRVVAALGLLLLAGNELWAQRPLRELRSPDFQGVIVRELEVQRRVPTALFRDIEPVFVLNEVAVNRMVYNPATGVLRWRYTVRPGVGRAAAAAVARRLQSFLVGSLIRARLVTQAQIDAGQFRVEVVGGEEALPGEEVLPGGPEGEMPAPPPGPSQPAENAPQTGGTITTGSVGYASYYPWWGCGWGYPCYWGYGWGGWYWGCWDYYSYPWCWGYYPWWSYYPAAYPTVVLAAPAATVVAASTAPVRSASASSGTMIARAPQANARLSRVSLSHRPAREEAESERPSAPPTFWRPATGADPDGLFWDGYTLYWQGRYGDALDSFEAALAERREDARFWYYKALCEKALGQVRAADASARQARTLRAQGLPSLERIGSVLERVQGNDRRFLNGEGDALAGR